MHRLLAFAPVLMVLIACNSPLGIYGDVQHPDSNATPPPQVQATTTAPSGPLDRLAGQNATELEGTWRYVCSAGGSDNGISTWEFAGSRFRVRYESFLFSKQKCSDVGAKGDTTETIEGTFSLDGQSTLGGGIENLTFTLESLKIETFNQDAVNFINKVCDRKWTSGATYEVVGQVSCSPSKKVMQAGAQILDLVRLSDAGLEFGNISAADEAKWAEANPRPAKISDNPYVTSQVYKRVQ